MIGRRIVRATLCAISPSVRAEIGLRFAILLYNIAALCLAKDNAQRIILKPWVALGKSMTANMLLILPIIFYLHCEIA